MCVCHMFIKVPTYLTNSSAKYLQLDDAAFRQIALYTCTFFSLCTLYNLSYNRSLDQSFVVLEIRARVSVCVWSSASVDRPPRRGH